MLVRKCRRQGEARGGWCFLPCLRKQEEEPNFRPETVRAGILSEKWGPARATNANRHRPIRVRCGRRRCRGVSTAVSTLASRTKGGSANLQRTSSTPSVPRPVPNFTTDWSPQFQHPLGQSCTPAGGRLASSTTPPQRCEHQPNGLSRNLSPITHGQWPGARDASPSIATPSDPPRPPSWSRSLYRGRQCPHALPLRRGETGAAASLSPAPRRFLQRIPLRGVEEARDATQAQTAPRLGHRGVLPQGQWAGWPKDCKPPSGFAPARLGALSKQCLNPHD